MPLIEELLKRLHAQTVKLLPEALNGKGCEGALVLWECVNDGLLEGVEAILLDPLQSFVFATNVTRRRGCNN